jgi:lactoylglutathione lyase
VTVAIVPSDIVVLFVRDLDASTRFYSDVLGMPFRHRDDHSSVYATDGGTLLLVDHEGADDLLGDKAIDHGARRGATAVHVAAVDDVDATYDALREKGVAFLRAPEDREWGLRTAHFADPDGNVWELHTELGGD